MRWSNSRMFNDRSIAHSSYLLWHHKRTDSSTVQEFRATKKDEPDEFIKSLQKQETMPVLGEVEKLATSKHITAQSAEWLVKVTKAHAHAHSLSVRRCSGCGTWW